MQTTITKQTARNLKASATRTRTEETIKFILEPMAGRPAAGAKLFAHTAAFLLMSGVIEGKPVSRTLARQVIGDTAINYHTKRGNFEKGADGLALTMKGEQYFAERDADMEAVNDYAEFFSTGKVGGNMQPVKNPAFILKVK